MPRTPSSGSSRPSESAGPNWPSNATTTRPGGSPSPTATSQAPAIFPELTSLSGSSGTPTGSVGKARALSKWTSRSSGEGGGSRMMI